jgi:hypothetical protein
MQRSAEPPDRDRRGHRRRPGVGARWGLRVTITTLFVYRIVQYWRDVELVLYMIH